MKVGLRLAEIELNNYSYSYTTNSTVLIDELDKFLDELKKQRYGLNLVHSLNTDFHPANSIVDDLIKYGRENVKETQWTTTTMLYSIHLKVVHSAIRENELLKIAVRSKGVLSNTTVTDELAYLERNRNDITAKFVESLRNTKSKLKNEDAKELLNLTPPNNDKIVRMKNFLQAFYEKEETLSDEDTCSRKCEHYTSIGHHRNGCFGTAKDCTYHRLVDYYFRKLILRVTYQTPQVDQIYTNYEEIKQNSYDMHVDPNQVNQQTL